MKTLRNLTFVVFIGSMITVDSGEVLALSPPEFQCPSGCSCAVTENNPLEVTGDCPEDAPIDVCPYVYDACQDYCGSPLASYMDELYPGYTHQCGYYELLGSCQGPYGLDPPTEEWICGCYCWQS